MKIIFSIISACIILQAAFSYAIPTQTGSTGLITVPSADTLAPGNACVGFWGDLSKNDDKHALIMPFALTIGLGSFWEAYASYPDIAFNDQEARSGKGWAEIGTKYRFYGKRNSNLKVAADLFLQRTISDNPAENGLTNYGGRLIGSYINESAGFHLFTGYLISGDPPDKTYNNEILYGAGLDYSTTPRTKVIVEAIGRTNKDSSMDPPVEGNIGLQYFLSPHLTLNVAGGFGITSASPEWRAIFGLTTCQGMGTYVKPVPKLVKPGENKPEKVVKPVKIVPISPLLMSAALPAAPVSNLEVQVEGDQEEVYVRPTAKVVIPVAQSPAMAVTLPPLTSQSSSDAKTERPSLVRKPKETEKQDTQGPPEPPPEERLRDGETPLYGIEVKGDKLSVGAVTNKPTGSSEKMVAFRKYRFPDVVFEYNQMELSEDVKKSLSEVAELLRNDKRWSFIRIDAHTDGIGSVNYNMDLSLKRAITIAGYLTIHEGIDPGKVFIKGMGKSKLIADNATTDGRKANRRFEILLLAPKEKQ